MEQNALNEAELLTHVCKILEQNNTALEKAAEQNEEILQIQDMKIDFGNRRVQIEELTIDFEAGDVQAWEKNIDLNVTEYEMLSRLANQLGVTVDDHGFLVRISGNNLEIPILLYITPTGAG